MVSPDRRELYSLTPDIPCLRPEQVDMDSWDDPLKEAFQTFQKDRLRTIKLIEWRSGTSWETHQGISKFTPLIVSDQYRIALYVAVEGWGRTVYPDKQIAAISEDSISKSGGYALYISKEPYYQSARRSLVALADLNHLHNRRQIWIAGEPDEQFLGIAGMVVLNAVQEAADRIRYVDQSLAL